MKKSNLLVIAILFSVVFTSCSTDDMMVQEEQSKELFNTYQLKRDANGAYSIDVKVEDNVSIDKFKNTTNNTNELYFTSSKDGLVQKGNYGSDLWFNNESFKIAMISDDSNQIASISIIDDNVKFAKKDANSFLNEYSISLNEEGTYDLEFDVLDNISVDFVYDDESNIYEIHLEESVKSQEITDYARTLEKEAGSLLEIHFVNHISSVAKSSSESFIRKPKVIIEGAND